MSIRGDLVANLIFGMFLNPFFFNQKNKFGELFPH